MTVDPGDLIRSLEIQAEEQVRRAETLRAEIESTSVGVESNGGELMVRVDSAGALTDLRFYPPAESLSRDELSRLVLATARLAQARLATRVSEVVASLYGSTSETTAFISDAYASRYPKPEDEDDDGEFRGHRP